MKDIWYADKRDLVKWAILFKLSELHKAQRIIQIAYYRPSEFSPIIVNGKDFLIPKKVVAHFRDIRHVTSIHGKAKVAVFDKVFQSRQAYHNATIKFISSFSQEKCIVFLDPDTGLEPRKPSLKHVLNSEVKCIWDVLKQGDIFVFYQHKTNRNSKPWIEPKRKQLSEALNISEDAVKVAHGPLIAHDVVFFYLPKP